MKLNIFKLWLFAIIILSPLFSNSQNIDKPKIGLVLSGGGAKGIAHIGILHALDSLNIKPDYITGTSMGSIMGALYAIGYSANEIDSIIREANWDYILSDDIPLNEIETNKKHSYDRSLLDFNFSGNLIPKLPSGIVYGQHISEYFSKLTWRSAGINNFNKFEIPYKCISADLISGKPWFFESGDLAIAMRSSMSIPTVFSPVKLDTMLLVDGGVYRNFPVIDAKEMGADILIGSYTGFEQKSSFEELTSLTKILMRTTIFSGIQDIKTQQEMCDYFIEYDLHGLQTKDFKRGNDISDYGKISMSNSSVLDSLVLLSKKMSKYPNTEEIILPERDSIIVSSINTHGLTMLSNEYMISKSGIEIGSKISKEDMTLALNSMMGTLLFEKITYTLSKDKISEDKDSFNIVFDVIEKPRGQMMVSVNYDNFFGPSLSTNFLIRNLLLDGSESHLRLNWSENPMAHLNYDMFMGKKKRIQATIGLKYEVSNIKSYFDLGSDFGSLNIGSQRNTQSEFYAKIVYNFNINNQLGIKYAYQISSISYKDGADIATELSGANEYGSALNLYYLHNNLNRQFYPTKGYKLYFSAKLGSPFKRYLSTINIDDNNSVPDSIINLTEYLQLELRYKHLIKVGDIVSLQPSIGIGISSDETSIMNSFILGGYSRLERINNINIIGSEPYSYNSDTYAMANFDIQFKVIDNLFITLLTNTTILLTYDDIGDEFIETDYFGTGLSLGYYSPLGPIDIGYSINSYGENYWHVNIGFPF